MNNKLDNKLNTARVFKQSPKPRMKKEKDFSIKYGFQNSLKPRFWRENFCEEFFHIKINN